MSSAAAIPAQRKGLGFVGWAAIILILLFSSPFLIIGTVLPALFAPASSSDLGTLGAGGNGPSGDTPWYVPGEIMYRPRTAAYAAIIEWLQARNSALADTEHLAAIEAAGQKWNIDPLLLLAVVGQEESFVPVNWNPAILNNPWNVFGSWQDWQGGFAQSAMWAANTIARLSQNCPQGVSVLQWVNGFGADGTRSNPGWGYAGDQNWWRGVSQFYAQLQRETGAGTGVVPPISGNPTITEEFQQVDSLHPNGHQGIDMAADAGTPVHACLGGQVTYARYNDGGYGNLVIVSDEYYEYYYAHLSSFNVTEGQTVSTGDLLGAVGSTGHSTGPHLHFGVKVKGTDTWIDPKGVLAKGGS
ncbi:MAG: Glycyl-glycine endopeptidase ALE-1 precursor [Pelotomaculum sp. PtaU1.Bin065]|nr:MAG: Glycyl-glycine endopeptidase ALE-1 precursor [Pelotomaculum sp. PtaU1.Bin065]